MGTSTSTSQLAGGARKSLVIVWVAILAVGAYFVIASIPYYLVWNAANYGPYYWPRSAILLPHLLGGLFAIVIGPFQFWSRIRNNHPKVHRISGRVYLISVAVGGVAGLLMAFTSDVNFVYASGLASLAIAWLLTSGMAFFAIRRRNFVQHKRWMIRSYVVTFAFVTFRVVDDVLSYYEIGEDAVRWGILAWACWAVPLLLTEIVLQGRQLSRS